MKFVIISNQFNHPSTTRNLRIQNRINGTTCLPGTAVAGSSIASTHNLLTATPGLQVDSTVVHLGRNATELLQNEPGLGRLLRTFATTVGAPNRAPSVGREFLLRWPNLRRLPALEPLVFLLPNAQIVVPEQTRQVRSTLLEWVGWIVEYFGHFD